MRILWQRLSQIDTATRIACALALVFVALAHRPAAGYMPADLSAYALPDGSVPSLCLPSEEGNGGAAKDTGCEYCRLAAATILPAPAAELIPAPLTGEAIDALTEAWSRKRPEFGTRSVRGPPTIS